MSVIADPQALYGRLIDKGVDNALARALSDALHDTPSGLATEASVPDLRHELREEMRQLREEMRLGFAATREESIKTNARIDFLPNALLIRLGSLMVVLAGLIVTAQRLWPPH